MEHQCPPRPFPTYDELQYEDFLSDHLLPNRPFLLSSRNTATWRARSWCQTPPHPSLSNETGEIETPNLSKLKELYGHHVVPTANTLKREYSEFEREERPLREVIELWESGKGEGLYVKDWHLLGEIEAEGRGVDEVYEVPTCFRDDWLNPPYKPRGRSDPSAACADFRFCYLGPAGTFTPLHRDVYASYSWSANIKGSKVWWLFDPSNLDGLKDKHGEFVFDVRDLESEGGGIKVLQEEGEVIFVPSGWYHQVLNIDFCISVNHNFFSSPTLPSVFSALLLNQQRVEESIADILPMIKERLGSETDAWKVEWAEEVQGLLERDAGWGWKGFSECVRDNIENPRTGPELRPSDDVRNAFIREVIHRYKALPEWTVLAPVKDIVLEIEASMALDIAPP